MVLFGVYTALYPICLSFNFSDFKVINSEISNDFNQYVLATKTSYDSLGYGSSTSTNADTEGHGTRRRLAYAEKYGYILYSQTDYYYRAIAADALTVFYYSKQTNNILTAELLEKVHLIEKGIKQYNGYRNHSIIYEETDANIKQIFGRQHTSLYLEASPGSFLNYIYPQILLGNYVFNGAGDALTLKNGDIEETIRTYNDIGDITGFFDFGFNFANVSSKYLAAIYPFGYQHGFESSADLYNWVASYKLNFFDQLDSSIGAYIGVAVSDSRGVILNDELYYYLAQDLNLAITSLIIIYLVLYMYCRSFYITTFGLLGVCCSFVPCFAIYEMVWGQSFNLINMVSIWVILGIGSDDICVFISSYRRAPLESINGEMIPNHLRLAFAYREAGSAMFVTSFTTAFSFFSLCLSTINPLPQFGWFLGSLVLTNFILVMTWFPVVLQSYVWFVMSSMEYDFHIDKCTKWLAVAVPLPQENEANNVNDPRRLSSRMSSMWRRKSVMTVMSGNRLYTHNANTRYNQKSIFFAVPDAQKRKSYLYGLDNSKMGQSMIDKRRQSIKKLSKRKNKSNDGSFEAETQFGDCTDLYFILMKKGLGIFLIAVVLILTIIFSYTASLITIPQETTKLLPDDTNWGKVNTALKEMDINTDDYGGYSAATGSSSGTIVVVGTSQPTKSPTMPTVPTTTLKPSKYPTATSLNPTVRPTLSPTTTTNAPTPTPTMSPTTNEPTTLNPSAPPTLPTTLSPSASPTRKPTFSVPIDPSYRCTNDGSLVTCTVDTFADINGNISHLRPTQIALVFEGGGLYAGHIANSSWDDDSEIIKCEYYNNISIYYDKNAYVSPHGYDVKWCFINQSPIPTSFARFEIATPYSSLMSTDWYTIALWLYFEGTWNQILNKKNEYSYNYSLDIAGYDDDSNYLGVDEALTINILCGTSAVTEIVTDCSGQVTSGKLIFDHNFNIYLNESQQRWNQLCDELHNIDDEIMYRRDSKQQICFSFALNEYLKNSTRGPMSRMPGKDTINPQLFNKYLIQFVSQPTSLSFSDVMPPFDPRKYVNWFGTKTSRKWYTSNASIAWIQQQVHTQINKKWGGTAMYEYYEKWDNFISDFNRKSPASFQCLQTSSAYIRMEVEVAFLNGFIQSVLYTMLLCSMVMIFFTQNLYLVLLVCAYILIIVIMVMGVFGAAGWPFGIIEIISVPTVIGLSIDYSLHITHAYIHSPFPDRLQRSKSAINDLGSSVFASAMTTISSMFILYFATIIVFSDLGWVVGTTTAFGVVLALFVCPPCLMYTGPQYNECHATWFVCCERYKEYNGFTIQGYTFCANKWHGYNREKAEKRRVEVALELQVANNSNLDNIIMEDDEAVADGIDTKAHFQYNENPMYGDDEDDDEEDTVTDDDGDDTDDDEYDMHTDSDTDDEGP